jgi:hypothetical protein
MDNWTYLGFWSNLEPDTQVMMEDISVAINSIEVKNFNTTRPYYDSILSEEWKRFWLNVLPNATELAHLATNNQFTPVIYLWDTAKIFGSLCPEFYFLLNYSNTPIDESKRFSVENGYTTFIPAFVDVA